MVDIKAIEGRLDYVRATMGAQHRFSIEQDELRDLLATVRELREALGAFLAHESAADCWEYEWATWECAAHAKNRVNGECPVSRARRLVNE